jgi:hypothetical protein
VAGGAGTGGGGKAAVRHDQIMSRVFVIGPASWNLLIHLPQLPRPEPQMMVARWHHETLGGTSAGKALNLRRLGVQVTRSPDLVTGDGTPT